MLHNLLFHQLHQELPSHPLHIVTQYHQLGNTKSLQYIYHQAQPHHHQIQYCPQAQPHHHHTNKKSTRVATGQVGIAFIQAA